MAKYFKHKVTGVSFSWNYAGNDAVMARPPHGSKNILFPHKIYLDNEVHGQGWRHACVKSSVAYVIVDEVWQDGSPVFITERWAIKHLYDDSLDGADHEYSYTKLMEDNYGAF